jgi:hypothetical protein
MLLGDAVREALSRLDITPQKVERWVGKPCGCKNRQEKLNSLHRWAIVSLRVTKEKAGEWLRGIMGMWN